MHSGYVEATGILNYCEANNNHYHLKRPRNGVLIGTWKKGLLQRGLSLVEGCSQIKITLQEGVSAIHTTTSFSSLPLLSLPGLSFGQISLTARSQECLLMQFISHLGRGHSGKVWRVDLEGQAEYLFHQMRINLT